MKILFVGEGSNDIGRSMPVRDLRPADGVVSALCRKLQPNISIESVAIQWKELSGFPKDKKKAGYVHKLRAAVEVAAMYNCAGTIAVVDEDNQEDRTQRLYDARDEIMNSHPSSSPIAVGVAVKAIEAWTLADRNALCQHLNIAVEEIEEFYKPAQVESLYQSSDKPEKRSWDILKKIVELANDKDCTDLRVAVATKTDIEVLKRHCPKGFKPFAEDVCSRFP